MARRVRLHMGRRVVEESYEQEDAGVGEDEDEEEEAEVGLYSSHAYLYLLLSRDPPSSPSA